MVSEDQPTRFSKDIIIAVSSKSDGQMQYGWTEAEVAVRSNRKAFLQKVGVGLDSTVLVRVRYLDGASYDIIKEVTYDNAGDGMYTQDGKIADCLVTQTQGLGLFLPIADCSATVVYDPIKKVLALAHLGRHSTIANLASKLVTYMKSNFASNSNDIKVWIGPSIKKTHYFLKTVDFAKKDPKWHLFFKESKDGFALDMQGYNKSQFIASGVPEEHITISNINTATDTNYWSHYTSRTIKGESAPPRFAVVVAIKPKKQM